MHCSALIITYIICIVMARFEPTIFCSVGGDDGHCTTPSGSNQRYLHFDVDNLNLGILPVGNLDVGVAKRL
jgi:hypothetical protein